MKSNQLKYLRLFLLIAVTTAIFSSCETPFVPDGVNLEEEIVVEGFIEAGEEDALPYVLLTKSVPFFSEFDPNAFEDLFVNNATVSVFDGETNWPFQEVCLDDVPDDLRPVIAERLGINPDSAFINICVYIQPFLRGKIGDTYDLTIELEDERIITASTTIPPHVMIDSLWFEKSSEFATADTLLEMVGLISDYPDRADFYRYYTAVNSAPIRAPFQSVIDDALFDGLTFEFPLANGAPISENADFETFGLYNVLDTAIIKWANLDSDHYDFWSTLEFNRASQGPFSSYTQVATNIEGGLGVWGGYSVSQYEIVVKE